MKNISGEIDRTSGRNKFICFPITKNGEAYPISLKALEIGCKEFFIKIKKEHLENYFLISCRIAKLKERNDKEDYFVMEIMLNDDMC